MSDAYEFPSGQPQELSISDDMHFRIAEQAAELRDGARESGSSMTFDEAYAVISTIEATMTYPVVQDGMSAVGRSRGLSDLTTTDIYLLSEALDTIMSFSTQPDKGAKISAAVLAAELYSTLPFTTDPAVKSTILEQRLGIAGQSQLSAAEQIAAKYFKDGSVDEQRLVARSIVARSRSYAPR